MGLLFDGVSPNLYRAIVWTNVELYLVWTAKFSKIFIKHKHYYKKCILKELSTKCDQFVLGNMLPT